MNKREQVKLLKIITKRIKHKDWKLKVDSTSDFLGIYWQWGAECSVTGLNLKVSSRRHYLGDDLVDWNHADFSDSVIKLARGALHEAMRHEADEFFLVDNKRVYDPHTTVASLLRLTGV
jgi:hypothetical protein